jgi:cyclophilin family peptidyl-prolyl cis-trans isomerase
VSGLEPDPDWRVRVALADAQVFIDRGVAQYRLSQMLGDADHRVLPPVLRSLAALQGREAAPQLLEHLTHDDVVVRKTAALLLAEVKAEEAIPALIQAYEAGRTDSTYLARAGALDALASMAGERAVETLERALADTDWAVRVRAASLLAGLGRTVDPMAMRPAPVGRAVSYGAAELISPTVSPHAYIETEKGTIEIELAVLEAPLTVLSFSSLAREGFYRGLTFHRVVPNFVAQGGDPRSDGEGGPGYTLRDELNPRPFIRGTVGIALDWADTGGSQFFLTHSPQPHLDGAYTVFGHVVAGLEVIDELEPGDLIRDVLIWDGVNPLRTEEIAPR